MKAISLWQPWASLVVLGKKRIETRSWATSYRGPLLVHAAKRWGPDERAICWERPFVDALAEFVGTMPGDRLLPLGCIIGMVNVTGCILTTAANVPAGDEYYFGDYAPGRYQWHTSDAIAFAEPIPWKGSQGFFDVPDQVIATARPRTQMTPSVASPTVFA